MAVFDKVPRLAMRTTFGGDSLAAIRATQYEAVTVTATADGLTTGIIPDTADFVTVVSADVNHIVTLPTAALGKEITIQAGATGFELRTPSPTTIGINGGVGAAAESAIAAGITTHLVSPTLTNWLGDSKTSAGVVGVTQVAAP